MKCDDACRLDECTDEHHYPSRSTIVAAFKDLHRIYTEYEKG